MLCRYSDCRSTQALSQEPEEAACQLHSRQHQNSVQCFSQRFVIRLSPRSISVFGQRKDSSEALIDTDFHRLIKGCFDARGSKFPASDPDYVILRLRRGNVRLLSISVLIKVSNCSGVFPKGGIAPGRFCFADAQRNLGGQGHTRIPPGNPRGYWAFRDSNLRVTPKVTPAAN